MKLIGLLWSRRSATRLPVSTMTRPSTTAMRVGARPMKE
jgi:hypothetical protein